MKVFSKFQKGLLKTKSGLVDGISQLVSKTRKIDNDLLDELEELLVLSDIGIQTAEKIIDDLKEKGKEARVVSKDDIISLLKEELVSALSEAPESFGIQLVEKPTVVSVVGVNGTGKTTSIGKLANRFAMDGKKVLLAAADTFRAAAIDQLEIWSQRAQVDIVKTQMDADPASVAYDALQAAIARNSDILLIDTAGRLQTKSNLMAELEKIHRVLGRLNPKAPHEVLLSMDATTGQNGLSQARRFAESVNVTGIILNKLDGTAKGGIVFSIAREMKIPVKYIGLGEQIDDIEEFDAKLFVEALF
jgi:fused signal recognition particle receptor